MFSGFSVSKGGSDTDAQWALRMHLGRVHAFLQSCARSGAEWTVHRATGQIACDGISGAVHRLNNNTLGEDNGFLTFFRYKNGEGFFLLLTLFRFQLNRLTKTTSTTPTAQQITIDALYSCYNQGSTGRHSAWGFNTANYGSSFFYAFSKNDFGEDISLYNFIPANSSRLMPCTQAYGPSNSLTSATNWPFVRSSNAGYMTISGACFGFCTKSNGDIILFTWSNVENVGIQACSFDGFSKLFNPSDANKMLIATLLIISGAQSEASTNVAASSVENYCNSWWNADGTAWGGFNYLNSSGEYQSSSIGAASSQRAIMTAAASCKSGDLIAFSGNLMKTGDTNDETYDLGSGLAMKGVINPELDCVSGCMGNSFTRFTTVKGGGLLIYYRATGYINCCGWDRSNPGLMSAEATPLYDPDVTLP